jgi:TolB-like protein/thioredoxin-like negative regulator of GroEL
VRAATLDELRTAHAKQSVVRLRDARPDLPTAFVRVVDRAIATDPQKRYASAGELEAELLKAFDESDQRRSRSIEIGRRRWSWIAMWSGAAALLMIGIVAFLAWWLGFQSKPTSTAAGPIRSIAVLPLANLSGDPSQEYFADGMTDELIGTLGRMGGVNVISRTSTIQFKGSKLPLPEIARALHVDAILEGSVVVVERSHAEQAGDGKRVRINARLIFAGTDTPLWDKTFETVVDDVLALQNQVANAVAEGIDLRLTSQRPGDSTRATRQNVRAQDAYLQGHYLLMNSTRRNDFVKAREYLERAVQIDPENARAYAALASCYGALEGYGVLPLEEAARLVGQSAAAAVRIDPLLPEAQAAFAGFAYLYEWNWPAADRAYRRAIEANPSYSVAHADYARFLMAEERLEEALQHARLAEQQDPLSADASGVVALTFYYQRRYREALTQRLKAAQLDPNSAIQHLSLGRIYTAVGEFDRAINELQRAISLSQRAPYIQAELARTYAASGRVRDARRLMTSLMNASRTKGPPLAAQYPAYMYAALGDADHAFEWLNKAADDREPSVLWAKVDPRLDPLRSDPRFDALLARLAPRP